MKNIKAIILTLALATVCEPGHALSVESIAGGLSDAVGANAGEVTALTVSGTVDVRDFEFISNGMPSLRSLDLSDARIASYSGAATALGRTASPADELPECALMCPGLGEVVLPVNLKTIADGALGSSGITDITIPASVTAIGTGAFSECRSLGTVTVPSSVKSLGINVFKGCTSLKSAVVAAPLPEIPDGTFGGCTALVSASLPATAETIGEGAFAGCGSLSDVNFPQALASIGPKAFYGTALKSADFSKTALKSIGRWAFAECPGLGMVEFDTALENIGIGAFHNDASLSITALPQGVSDISDFSLRGIMDASETALADTKVEHIGAYALANWKGVQTFALPATLKSLGDGAMANWSDVSSISATELTTVPVLGEDVWRGVQQSNVDLIVPSELEQGFKDAAQWNEFNVKSKNSTTDQTMVMHPGAAGEIKARFDGLNLIIEAGTDIAGVQIFDVQGRSYAFPATAESHRTVIDTSAWNVTVLIVRVVLSDGSAAALKLTR